MARPGFKKKGGFLNNQDATLLGVTFSERSTEKGNWLFAAVQVREDGKEPTALFDMFCGSADNFEIGDEGATAMPVSPDVQLDSDELSRFLKELEVAGYPASNIAQFWGELTDPIDFRSMSGTRVHFVQVDDPEKTKELGQRRGTDGKMYNRTRPQVSQVLSLPPTKAETKPTKAVAAAPKGKNGKATDTNLVEVADGVLVAIISDNGGSIQKSRLPVSISRAVDKADPNRRALQDLIYSTDYIDGAVVRGLIAYDAKAQTISLA